MADPLEDFEFELDPESVVVDQEWFEDLYHAARDGKKKKRKQAVVVLAIFADALSKMLGEAGKKIRALENECAALRHVDPAGPMTASNKEESPPECHLERAPDATSTS
jgi:hypothetical protein